MKKDTQANKIKWKPHDILSLNIQHYKHLVSIFSNFGGHQITLLEGTIQMNVGICYDLQRVSKSNPNMTTERKNKVFIAMNKPPRT